MKRPTIVAVARLAGYLVPLVASVAFGADGGKSTVTPELRAQAVDVMRQSLHNESRWVKVHAAEYLLELDYSDDVRQVFQAEQDRFGNQPEYRIGVWRVLARAAVSDQLRQPYVQRIRDVFLDLNASDRLHAVETLAKLGYQADDQTLKALQAAAEGADGRMAAYALWTLVNSDVDHAEERLARLLRSERAPTRQTAAYALRHLPNLSAQTQRALFEALRKEPDDSPGGVFLLTAAVAQVEDAKQHRNLMVSVRFLAAVETLENRRQLIETLAQVGQPGDLAMLERLLVDGGADADLRQTAAYALLRIERRQPHGITALDWSVIALYLAGMLAVGWFYARRTQTADDYLVGGRRMKPLAVGLSLFATLLSTISYLAVPGELIRHGPMVLGAIIAFPLVYLLAGWLIIPFIMKLRITSAYELLETRLGLSVRTLGAFFFLAMRLLWMAVIIFATTDKVLVPLLELPPSATPYLCALLGVITLVYTSLGGLRAVVLTDVVQSLILFGAAAAAIVLISVQLGGPSGWIPMEKPPHWAEIEFGFGSAASVRMTFLTAAIATFVWWICTAGSDQMAVQRYLATRDAAAARRVLLTSLVANTLVYLLLAATGLALLAYFRANPHLVPDGQTILDNPDTLFTRFVAVGLPTGISGLVVAGLLAAAMSSLSSGVNSSSLVITVDFLDRFAKSRRERTDRQRIRRAKVVSVGVGLAVVALSSCVGLVEGNLLEVAYKVVNLLTAPLFGLFFMAMFVRWANGPGTLVGAAVGVAVVTLINYSNELFGSQPISFIWAMPLSLTAQIVVGSVASLALGGRRDK